MRTGLSMHRRTQRRTERQRLTSKGRIRTGRGVRTRLSMHGRTQRRTERLTSKDPDQKRCSRRGREARSSHNGSCYTPTMSPPPPRSKGFKTEREDQGFKTEREHIIKKRKAIFNPCFQKIVFLIVFSTVQRMLRNTVICTRKIERSKHSKALQSTPKHSKALQV